MAFLTVKEECEKLDGYIQDCDIPNIEKIRENQIKDNVDYTKCPYDMIGKRFDYIEVLPIDPKVRKRSRGRKEYYYYCLCHKCGKIETRVRPSLFLNYLEKIKHKICCRTCGVSISNKNKLIGKIINNWKIISVHHEEWEKHKVVFYYNCECICCKEKIVSTAKNLHRKLCQKRKNENRKLINYMQENITYCKTPKGIKDLVGEKFGELTVKSYGFVDLLNSNYWLCECSCGTIYYIKEENLLSKHTLSCGCQKSKGELKIIYFLKNNNIKYVHQFKTKECRNKEMLPFDFKIFYDKNHYFLLEYQGEQHYSPQDFSYNKTYLESWQKFLRTIINDDIKRKFCKENNIELLEIPYWNYNDIEKILKEKLNIVD